MANATTKSVSPKPAKPQAAAGTSTAAGSPAESRPNGLITCSAAPMTAEARREMIAEAAYYIAEQRGFGDGHDVENWLLAEKQIDAALSA